MQTLRGGFQALTLAPGPRLREHRERLAGRNLTAEAWNDVATALRKAVTEVGLSIDKRSSHS